MKKLIIVASLSILALVGFSQDSTYNFKGNYRVISCGDIFLQKISEDYVADLNIEVAISKLPLNKKLKIEDHISEISGLFVKYPVGNTYVAPLCSDAKPTKSSLTPLGTYRLKMGVCKIITNKENPNKVTIELKKMVFMADDGSKIILLYEVFDNVALGWIPG